MSDRVELVAEVRRSARILLLACVAYILAIFVTVAAVVFAAGGTP